MGAAGTPASPAAARGKPVTAAPAAPAASQPRTPSLSNPTPATAAAAAGQRQGPTTSANQQPPTAPAAAAKAAQSDRPQYFTGQLPLGRQPPPGPPPPKNRWLLSKSLPVDVRLLGAGLVAAGGAAAYYKYGTYDGAGKQPQGDENGSENGALGPGFDATSTPAYEDHDVVVIGTPGLSSQAYAHYLCWYAAHV